MGRPPKLRKAKSTTALNRTESIEGHQLAKLSAELLDWKPEEAQAIMFETLQVR